MKEIIIELISTYSPAIVAIVTTICSVITFFNKVKKIAKNNDDSISTLKSALKDSHERIVEISGKYSLINENLVEELKRANEEIEELSIRNDNLTKEIEVLEEEARDLATIRNQLTELLRKEGE